MDRIKISATESRCAECGLGSTSRPLVMISDPASAPSQEEGLARLEAMMGQQVQRFESASFSPFALDERWTGVRSFAGFGGSNDETVRLSLAHGDPFDPGSALVRVETRKPRHIGLGGPGDPRMEYALLTAELVGQFRDLTGILDDDVRAAAFPYQDPNAYESDSTAPWDDASIAVDGHATRFKVLADNDAWVASAPYDERFIGISAQHWPLTDTGLVTVDEFDVYAEGSAAIAARARDPDPPPSPDPPA
ncbi:MAG: hypothetical protein ACXVKA_07750 [Acidimicrobiia bacterium]